MGIIYKTAEQIQLVRESSRLVSKTLGLMGEMIRPGITPLSLNDAADTYIRDNGGLPGFLDGYHS